MNAFPELTQAYHSIVSQPQVIVLGHIIGLLGMACIVIAYYLIERGRLHRDDEKYYYLNLIGAALLEISLVINFNLGSFVIEIFWMIISIVGLIRIKKNVKK